MDPMKDISKINFNVTNDCIKDEIFRKSELWERKTHGSHLIISLRTPYLLKVALGSKKITEEE